jgi:hypothetical protein
MICLLFLYPNFGLHQRIRPGPMLFMTFRNELLFTVRGCSPTPNPQAGGPLLVVCPWLLIQYIRSYPPLLGAVPPSATRGRPCCRDKGTHLTLSEKINKRSRIARVCLWFHWRQSTSHSQTVHNRVFSFTRYTEYRLFFHKNKRRWVFTGV